MEISKLSFQQSLQREFRHQAPDVNTLSINFADAESFGLRVESRFQNCNVFEFNVESKLTFLELAK